jgi:3-deoxy-manno-octulosonate cytidylyltransferase (CMP-KDO synthetase)
MKSVIIIPARFKSSRLPGKPLIKLAGTSMIVRTFRQCAKACKEEDIYVATEDDRIEKECREHNIQVLRTSDECLTGTDRVAECSQQIEADVYINVQGDEPLFNPDDLKAIMTAASASPKAIINGMCEIAKREDFYSPMIPKVVACPDGTLLYMSRGPIPANKEQQFVKAWRQVCAYAFPKDALQAFSRVKQKTPLEALEDIEILRFLELGFKVKMIHLSSKSIAVDVIEDVAKVESALNEEKLTIS